MTRGLQAERWIKLFQSNPLNFLINHPPPDLQRKTGTPWLLTCKGAKQLQYCTCHKNLATQGLKPTPWISGFLEGPFANRYPSNPPLQPLETFSENCHKLYQIVTRVLWRVAASFCPDQILSFFPTWGHVQPRLLTPPCALIARNAALIWPMGVLSPKTGIVRTAPQDESKPRTPHASIVLTARSRMGYLKELVFVKFVNVLLRSNALGGMMLCCNSNFTNPQNPLAPSTTPAPWGETCLAFARGDFNAVPDPNNRQCWTRPQYGEIKCPLHPNGGWVTPRTDTTSQKFLELWQTENEICSNLHCMGGIIETQEKCDSCRMLQICFYNYCVLLLLSFVGRCWVLIMSPLWEPPTSPGNWYRYGHHLVAWIGFELGSKAPMKLDETWMLKSIGDLPSHVRERVRGGHWAERSVFVEQRGAQQWDLFARGFHEEVRGCSIADDEERQVPTGGKRDTKKFHVQIEQISWLRLYYW